MSYHYLLENGSGALLLEDGSDYLLLENAQPIPVILFTPTVFSLVVNGFRSVTLTWPALASSLIEGYVVWRDGKIITAPIVGATYTDSTVVAGHHYSYAVSAVDTSGNVGPQTLTLRADVPPAANLTFESVFQEQPGEGGYPDILWRWE